MQLIEKKAAGRCSFHLDRICFYKKDDDFYISEGLSLEDILRGCVFSLPEAPYSPARPEAPAGYEDFPHPIDSR